MLEKTPIKHKAADHESLKRSQVNKPEGIAPECRVYEVYLSSVIETMCFVK